MPGKTIYYLSFGILGVLVAVMLHFGRYQRMNPGSKMPDLIFEGKMGKELLVHDSTMTTIIIWFHPDCEHCLYQLTRINAHIDELSNTKFFFLTADKHFPSTRHLGLWPNLTSAGHVRFGILDKERFMALFGKVITPTTFIFDRRGRLIEKIFGEVKIRKIQYILDSINVPEHGKKHSGVN
jgi:peroxiredoxin